MATAKRVDKKKGHRPPTSPHEQAFPMLDNASIVTPIKQTPSKDNTMPEVTRLSANDDVHKNDINNPTTLNDLLQQTTDGRGEEHAQLWGMDGTRSMDSVAEMVKDTEGKDDERPTSDMNMANTSAKPSRMLLSPSGYSGGTSHAASNTPESFLLNVSIVVHLSFVSFDNEHCSVTDSSIFEQFTHRKMRKTHILQHKSLVSLPQLKHCIILHQLWVWITQT